MFERSRFKDEVGAAITMTSSAARILAHWGFDFERAGAVELLQIKIMDGSSLQQLFKDTFPKDEEKYGQKSWLFHRVDLHEGLRRLALDSQSSDGKPAIINLAAEVTALDCEKGTLTLKDGRDIQKDLIIIADGIHVSVVHSTRGLTRAMGH